MLYSTYVLVTLLGNWIVRNYGDSIFRNLKQCDDPGFSGGDGGSRFNRLLYCGFRWAYPLSCSIAPPQHPTIYDHQSQLLICLQ